ncbi:class I adenylate-forming enzyme family protein [Marinibacterium profundimaris]|uniref:Long-chain fatty acid--CoA ligase n=1 Tax=Marinibacterium profundimaris TaxID=1679460 RepID=A0A225NSG6_9RHOB|nr:AMP-binding protein [Marinibacterium profundimaris]OWU77759.1 long-chain fatty acid--CoA ligase [Marinibacterium profundimaris]
MSYDDAVDHVLRTDPTWAYDTAEIRGVTYRVFRNAPAHVPALLRQSRGKHDGGAADFLVYGDERLSYDATLAQVDALADALRTRMGLGPGDRIAIAMRNYPEYLVTMLAAASIGAVTVFLNAWWTEEEMDYALLDSGARVVVADGPRLARISGLIAPLGLRVIGVRDGEAGCQAGRALSPYSTLIAAGDPARARDADIDPDDDFAIMYSSGTTGHPKGVVLTHRGVITAVWSWAMQTVVLPLVTPPAPDAPPPLRPAMLITTPLFHVTALFPQFMLTIPMGAKTVLMHKWDAQEALRLIETEEITRFLGVPTQSADLLAAARETGATLPSLRYMGSGGAKRPAAHVPGLAQTFHNAGVATGWGMTETTALGIGMVGAAYEARPDAAGRLYPPVQELRIVDDAGRPLPNGELGEIIVKSAAVMRGYLNQPEATAETLRDGWLYTGDLGILDDEGFVTILDRKKNIIIRGGENIACLDVEGALAAHPDVIEACAFSIPDDRLGEIVGAALQLRPGASLSQQDLAAFLDGRIAHFKIPERIWCQEAPLPRGATDKTDRRAVRAACLGG